MLAHLIFPPFVSFIADSKTNKNQNPPWEIKCKKAYISFLGIMKLGLHRESSSITLVKNVKSLDSAVSVKKAALLVNIVYAAGVAGKMHVVTAALPMLFVHVDCLLIVVAVVTDGACSYS